MRHLYDSLRTCAKEEEVKAEFCKFFKMKIFALRGIDHYTEHVLFEFKHDRNFRSTCSETCSFRRLSATIRCRMIRCDSCGTCVEPIVRDGENVI